MNSSYYNHTSNNSQQQQRNSRYQYSTSVTPNVGNRPISSPTRSPRSPANTSARSPMFGSRSSNTSQTNLSNVNTLRSFHYSFLNIKEEESHNLCVQNSKKSLVEEKMNELSCLVKEMEDTEWMFVKPNNNISTSHNHRGIGTVSSVGRTGAFDDCFISFGRRL